MSALQRIACVRMNLHFEYPYGTYFVPGRSWGNRYVWLSLTGPGRVGLQSHFEPMEDGGYRLDSVEPNSTETQW